MKQLKVLAQYYVDLLVKLGIVRFSMLLALALVALAVVVQVGITLVLEGTVQNIDIIRSVFFWSDHHSLGGLFFICGRGSTRRITPALVQTGLKA